MVCECSFVEIEFFTDFFDLLNPSFGKKESLLQLLVYGLLRFPPNPSIS